MFTVATAPFAIELKLHVTGTVPLHEPWFGMAETNAGAAGSASVTITLVAGDGPLFVTVMWYVRPAREVAGFGDAVFVIARFALAVPETAS